ncbi:zinc-dependent metalloprotease, partial [Streptomyces albireticuli]
REPVAIDMIVGYTPAAERRVGGQQAVEARIQQAEAFINQAFASSNVPASVHIIGFYRASNYPYNRDEIASVLFGKLSNANDPQLGRQAHQLREEYGVDLIGLFFDVPPGQSSGQGSLPGPNTQRWDREAFSVTDVQSVVDWYNFGHEVGHNLGLWHDRITLKGQVSEEYIKANVNAPYGHGYITPNRRWHTLMAYSSSCGQPCAPVNQYSNTENTINGQPLGDRDSNNAELARHTTPIVAGYRNLTKAILRYQLVLSESQGGFIRPDFFGPYRPGTLVGIKAYPDPGCRVAGWEVDGHFYPHSENQLNVNVAGPGTVRALFVCA